MGFLKGLLGLGVTAGAAFAALKVAQKYEENKAADAAAAAAGAEPQDVPAGSVLEDIARAAGGVLSDAGAKVKEVVTGTAEKAGVDTVELKGALHDAGDALYEAGDAVADAGSAFAGYVAEEAPAVAGRLRDGAEDLLERVKETVAAGAQAVEEAADAAQAAAAEGSDGAGRSRRTGGGEAGEGNRGRGCDGAGNRAAAGKIKKTRRPEAATAGRREFFEAKNISQTLLPGVK